MSRRNSKSNRRRPLIAPRLLPAGEEAANPWRLRKTLLEFSPPDIADEDVDEVVTTLRSGWLARGSRARQFEEGLRSYIGCEHAMEVNSCSAGLELCLEAMGIGPGDEVITTGITDVEVEEAIRPYRFASSPDMK